jgi:hypothetical protein
MLSICRRKRPNIALISVNKINILLLIVIIFVLCYNDSIARRDSNSNPNTNEVEMFGLEKQKKKKTTDEFVFDLEKDLKDSKKRKELHDKVENRIQEIKEILRSGENKDEFDKFGVLLHGYTSLLKVIARFNAAK